MEQPGSAAASDGQACASSLALPPRPADGTVENPFELGDHGLRHQHVQFGGGSFDPVLVLEATRSLQPVTLEAFAQGQVSLYENSHGYRAPWRLSAGGAVGTKLFGDLSGALGAELFHEDAERWDGAIRQDGNLGRTELLAAAMLRQVVGKGVLSLSARVPVWRNIVVGDEPPGTLASPLILSLSYSHAFDLSAEEPSGPERVK